jgi:hypothetical protein
MSMAGLIANILVTFDLVDITYTNISELTNGSFTRDDNVGDSYIFPYNLGFILSGSGKLSLFGFEFYRISGWAHEPTSATLFIAPALILLIHTRTINNTILRFMIFITILSFWFFSMSIGSLLAFIGIYFITILLTLYTKIFPLKLSISIVLFFILITLMAVFYIEPLLESSIFSSKFNMESDTFKKFMVELTWFIPKPENNQVFYFSHLAIWSIIFLFILVIVFSTISHESLKVFSLILLYIVIHTMKGSQENVYTHVFTSFWFYAAYFSNYYRRKIV